MMPLSLDAGSYKHVQRWAKEVGERPAVKRGRIVNRTNGPLNEQLHERHDASDFETNTEDKRQGKSSRLSRRKRILKISVSVLLTGWCSNGPPAE